MKTTIKLFGIIALVALIGFSFIACDDGNGGGGGGGGTNSSLVGTWVLDDIPEYEMTIFSNGTVEQRVFGITDTGTITTSGNRYSITSNFMNGAVVEAGTYSISGNKLTMTMDEQYRGQNTTGINTFTRKR